MKRFKPGDAFKFANEYGSYGLVEQTTGYDADTYYVRYYFGLDVVGKPISDLASCPARNMLPITRKMFNEFTQIYAFSGEQRAIGKRHWLKLNKTHGRKKC